MTDGLLGIAGEVQVVAAHALTLASKECLGDFQHVATALAQRRQFERDDVQSVIEVFTELAGLGQGFQVAVGGRDQAHIDLLRLHRANPTNLTFLQHPEQPSLSLERQFADFVEEQRSAVGGFDQACTSSAGAGKGTFLMAEQFGLDQCFRNGCTVNRNHRCLGAPRKVVQSAGDQFLAGARFALNQHVGIGRGYLANLAEQILHRCAVTDDADVVSYCLARCAGLAADGLCQDRSALLMIVKNPGDRLQHFVVVERLGDVIDRAHLHRVHG